MNMPVIASCHFQTNNHLWQQDTVTFPVWCSNIIPYIEFTIQVTIQSHNCNSVFVCVGRASWHYAGCSEWSSACGWCQPQKQCVQFPAFTGEVTNHFNIVILKTLQSKTSFDTINKAYCNYWMGGVLQVMHFKVIWFVQVSTWYHRPILKIMILEFKNLYLYIKID